MTFAQAKEYMFKHVLVASNKYVRLLRVLRKAENEKKDKEIFERQFVRDVKELYNIKQD